MAEANSERIVNELNQPSFKKSQAQWLSKTVV